MHVVCLIFNIACVTAIFVGNVYLIKKKKSQEKYTVYIIWYAFLLFSLVWFTQVIYNTCMSDIYGKWFINAKHLDL